MRHADRAIAVSLAGLPFLFAHVVEDFNEGIAARFGLATGVAALLLGAWLALQSLGLVLLGRHRPAGRVITIVVGIVWVVGALVDHGPSVLAGGFRTGPLSVAFVAGLVLSQAAAAGLAWREGRGR